MIGEGLAVLLCLLLGGAVVIGCGWLTGVVVLWWRDVRSSAAWRGGTQQW